MLSGKEVDQTAIDEVVMGCARGSRRSLHKALAPEYVNARSSLGMSPLFSACYALWLEGARALLGAGADPFEVGFGSAVDAVELGVRDAGGNMRNVDAQRLVDLLCRYGVDSAATVANERISMQEARHLRLVA